MIQQFFKFRSKQFFRILSDIGVIRLLLVSLLLFVGFAYLYKGNNQYIACCLYLFLVLTIHNRRKDKETLTYLYGTHSIAIYYIEYALLSIPFICREILHFNIYVIPIYVLSILIVPHLLNFNVRLPKIKTPFFRKGSYEYIIFFRKNIIYILAMYLVSLLGIYNHNERILYVFAILFYLILFSNLLTVEDKSYIRMYVSSRYLLQTKFINIVQNTTILFVPFFILGYKYLHIVALIYLVGLLTVMCSQCIKYMIQSQIIVIIYSLAGLFPLAIICGMYPVVILAYVAVCLFLALMANSVLNNEYFRNK